MRRRWLVVACLLLLFMGGASALATWGGHRDSLPTSTHVAASSTTTTGTAIEPGILVTCRIESTTGDVGLAGATCRYQFGAADIVKVAPFNGAVERMMPPVRGNITASAPGYISQTHEIQTDENATETFLLEPLPRDVKTPPSGSTNSTQPPGGQGGGSGSNGGSNPQRTNPEASGAQPPPWPPTPPAPPPGHWERQWRAPVPVSAGGYEPHVAVDKNGIIYYAPTSLLYRSVDGGATWEDVSPQMPTALPTSGSDDSVSIAPDNSVWYSRYWGYPDATIGCTSNDLKDGAATWTWTCNNNAVAGVTDRMWIVGKDSLTGFVQSGEGLTDPQWTKTTDGSATYLNCATSQTVTQHGNLVYDDVNNKVWQIGYGLSLLRVDPCFADIEPTPIGVPNSLALPWVSIYKGRMWTTGNPVLADGSGMLVAARSFDEGATWQQFPIALPTTVASITHSYIGYGPEDLAGSHTEGDTAYPGSPGVGRYVAIVYYGSDTPGTPATANMGDWSLHVVHAELADGPAPTWIDDTVVPLVHTGNICTGLFCEQNGDDPAARFAGDLIGAWVDQTGLAHLAYQDDTSGTGIAMYARQDWVYVTPP
ncbi:MAG: hypothetical protein V4510_08975 [bacterium]